MKRFQVKDFALLDLDASFVVRIAPNTEGYLYGGSRYVATLNEAQGMNFQCPICAVGKERREEDGRCFVIGAHYFLCWFRNPRVLEAVPDDADPGPGRWWAEGTGLHDLTFGHGTPSQAKSVLSHGGCRAHFYITNGICHPC